jgi:hypothetical protein
VQEPCGAAHLQDFCFATSEFAEYSESFDCLESAKWNSGLSSGGQRAPSLAVGALKVASVKTAYSDRKNEKWITWKLPRIPRISYR